MSLFTRSRAHRAATSFTLACTVLGAAAASAAAEATISIAPGSTTLTISAQANRANVLTLSSVGNTYTVVGAAPLTAGAGCAIAGPSFTGVRTVRCTKAGLTGVSASLGNLPDVFTATPTFPKKITVNPGTEPDVVSLGAGADVVLASDGEDVINGFGGNNSLSGGNGADVITGGPQNDTISGGAGNDVIVGGLGNDSLNGGTDSDTVTGDLPGLGLGGGNDTINIRHADYDSVDCGAGTDVVSADTLLSIFLPRDFPTPFCETVNRA